jgi:DNA-binding response OmpR family regulator
METERRILVVDDDPDTDFSPKFLKSLNASVEVAQTLNEARNALSEIDADTVVILDLMFPENTDDGLDFLREIKQDYKETPVIVHTAAPMPHVQETAMDLGADDVIQKAGDPEELRNAIMLASGLELKTAEVLCQVVAVDDRVVRVQIPGEEGWVAEREFDKRFCPATACTVGSAFWLDTFRARHDGKDEYVLRSRGVDPEWDRAAVASWFAGIDEDAIDRL